jgi:hypothetical protein
MVEFNSGAAGYRAAQQMHLKRIEKGIVPLLNPEEMSTLPEKKINPAFVYHKWIAGGFIIIFLACMLGLPFAFYFLQRALIMAPDTLLFENMLPSVLSLFPGIGMAYLLSTLIYYLIRGAWPGIDIASAYSSIITANKMYWGAFSNSIPWERGITKKHIETVLKEDAKTHRFAIILCLIICIPLYYLCWTTYRQVTPQTWTESLMGSKTVYQLEDVKRVEASLRLVEETSDNETEIQAKMALNVFVAGKTEPFELCNSDCFYTHTQVSQVLDVLQDDASVQFSASELKAYEREYMLQQNDSYKLKLLDQVRSASQR